jgi:hypothetical protein
MKISKLGAGAALIYLVVALLLFLEANNCNGVFCSVGMYFPMWPWYTFNNDGLNVVLFKLGSPTFFWPTIAVNAVILYLAGTMLQPLFQTLLGTISAQPPKK